MIWGCGGYTLTSKSKILLTNTTSNCKMARCLNVWSFRAAHWRWVLTSMWKNTALFKWASRSYSVRSTTQKTEETRGQMSGCLPLTDAIRQVLMKVQIICPFTAKYMGQLAISNTTNNTLNITTTRPKSILSTTRPVPNKFWQSKLMWNKKLTWI